MARLSARACARVCVGARVERHRHKKCERILAADISEATCLRAGRKSIIYTDRYVWLARSEWRFSRESRIPRLGERVEEGYGYVRGWKAVEKGKA